MQKLFQTEQIIEEIANSISDVIYVYNLMEEKMTFINHQVKNLLSEDNQNLQIIHPLDARRRQQHLTSCYDLKKGEVKEIKLRLKAKDGNWHWFKIREHAFRWSNAGTVREIIGVATDIQAEMEKEEIMQSQAEFIQKIIALSPDIISVFDFEQDRHIYFNHELQHTLGISSAVSPERSTLPELIHPDDRKAVQQFTERIRESQDLEVQEVTYRVQSKNKGWIWYFARGLVFERDKNGKVTHYLGINQNITKAVMAEEGVRNREKLLESAFSVVPYPLAYYRALRHNDKIIDFEIMFQNAACESYLGKWKAGNRLTQRLPGIEKTAVFKRYLEVLDSGKEQIFKEYYGANGVDSWWQISVIKYEDGIVVQAEDITEHEKYRTLLQRLTKSDRFCFAYARAERNAKGVFKAFHYEMKEEECSSWMNYFLDSEKSNPGRVNRMMVVLQTGIADNWEEKGDYFYRVYAEKFGDGVLLSAEMLPSGLDMTEKKAKKVRRDAK